jgi:drug/metabolite transporter (DMT)-like permease
MIAIAGGLTAAFLWAVANLASTRASRMIGAASTLAWMLTIGMIIGTPLALMSGPLPPLTPALALWLAGSGLGSVVGLMFMYRGLRIGKVGVVLALASTEGAIAAVIAVFAGESMTIPAGLMLAVIAVGIVVVSVATGDADAAAAAAAATLAENAAEAADPGSVNGAAATARRAEKRRVELGAERRAALFGTAAALCFGFGIYSTGQLGVALPPLVAVMPVRFVGFVGVLIPLAIAGRLRMTRAAVPFVLVVALGELIGNVAYVTGAKESIAVAAVIASQYAAFGAVGAFFLFRERLQPLQRYGIVTICVGVAVLTAVRG